MSVATIFVPECPPSCGEYETVCEHQAPVTLSPVSGRVRVKSRREQLCDAITGCVEDLEADIADGRLLRAPDVARRMRELRADIAALGARDLGATYVTEIDITRGDQ